MAVAAMLAACAQAAPLFEVTDAARPPAWVAEPEACVVRDTPHGPAVAARVGEDAYAPVALTLRTAEAAAWPAEPFVLEVRHVDDGAGLIGAAWRPAGDTAWRGAAKSAAVARLNTGAERRAWFGFDGGGGGSGRIEVQIAGAPWVRVVALLPAQDAAAWAQVRAEIPRTVTPMVRLERPMELVTTAGIDVTGGFDALEGSLEQIRETAPLARVLGFTAIESYATWKRLEPDREGVFDFSFYDALAAALGEHGLKWFPLLIVGSAYALPDWFVQSPENHGMRCVEHGIENPIQSIAAPSHRRHVTRVLEAFGAHYQPMGVLEGVRLGPSGNYGESQYPAGGNWGAKGKAMHIHIGWWSGDDFAAADYRRWLAVRYADIGALNAAWGSAWSGFDAVPMVLPEQMPAMRQRYDYTAWYTDLMSDWCAWWAAEARRAMPATPLYQSAGGWGFREAGTDYAAQTRAMAALGGGIRLTNETDSYEQNFCVTRLAATAARLHGARLGYEPASSHTARGIVGRLYHTAATNGDHFFTYQGNIFGHPLAIAKWLEYLPVLDARGAPLVEIALAYPETSNQIEDGAFRHLYASGFYARASAIRRVADVDYLDESLMRGFLGRYRVLVWVWGNVIDAETLEAIGAWVRAGGTLVYPSFPRGPLTTVDGDTKVFDALAKGDTGAGRFHRFPGDMEPPERYAEFVRGIVLDTPGLRPATYRAIAAARPPHVFLTAQEDGHALVLNYGDAPATVSIPDAPPAAVPGYGIARMPLPQSEYRP